MTKPFSTLSSRLGVGRKLMPIHRLDLSAVIFISGILIDEKFIAIDRSFIRNLPVNPADLAITRAIIGLGHTLGMTVIAARRRAGLTAGPADEDLPSLDAHRRCNCSNVTRLSPR